jgi:MFS family permease
MAESLSCYNARAVWFRSVSNSQPLEIPSYAIESTFGTSVYTPALAEIMAEFNVSRTVALIGITVYTLGLAFGPIISAP